MLEVRALRFRFGDRRPLIEDATFEIAPGEVVGLSGRSGGGKSTLGRILAGHLAPQGGDIHLDGNRMRSRAFQSIQCCTQTPFFVQNPRWRIARILTEAYEPTPELRQAFGIEPSWDTRFPHELSGGQLQRVSLLRALTPGIRYLIADEITSALDPVSQADLWHTLLPIARRRNIGILAISHDAALLERIADRRLALTPAGTLVETTTPMVFRYAKAS